MAGYCDMRKAWQSCAVAGHFGEFLQGRLGAQGPVSLITVPCPALSVSASWNREGPLLLHTPKRLLTRGDISKIGNALKINPRGRLILRSDMPPGGGGGASTAALMAVTRLFAGRELRPEQIAQICLRIEGASDPLMHPNPERLLWASRAGKILRQLPALPRFEVIGGFDGPVQRTRAGDQNFADISDLVARWPDACAVGAGPVAALSSASAWRNFERRGGNTLAPLTECAKNLGALGIVAAHTGSARGLLFAPGSSGLISAPAALRSLGMTGVTRFSTNKGA